MMEEDAPSSNEPLADVITGTWKENNLFCCVCRKPVYSAIKLFTHLRSYEHKICVARCKSLFEDHGEKVFCKTCETEIEWKEIQLHGLKHQLPPWFELKKPSSQTFFDNHTVLFAKGYYFCYLCEKFLDYWDTASSHFMEAEHQERKVKFGPTLDVSNFDHMCAITNGIVPGRNMAFDCKMCCKIGLRAGHIEKHSKTQEHKENTIKTAANILKLYETKQNSVVSGTSSMEAEESTSELLKSDPLKNDDGPNTIQPQLIMNDQKQFSVLSHAFIDAKSNVCSACCKHFKNVEKHLISYEHKIHVKRCTTVFDVRGKKFHCKACNLEIKVKEIELHVRKHEIPPWCKSGKPDSQTFYHNRTVTFDGFHYCFLCETFLDYWDTAMFHFMEANHQKRKKLFGPMESVNSNYELTRTQGIVPGKDLMNECKMCNITGLETKDVKEHVKKVEHKTNREKFAADIVRKHEENKNATDSVSNAADPNESMSELLETASPEEDEEQSPEETGNIIETAYSPVGKHVEPSDEAFANRITGSEAENNVFCCVCNEALNAEFKQHSLKYEHQRRLEKSKLEFEDRGKNVFCKICSCEIEWKEIVHHGEMHGIPPWSEITKLSCETLYYNHTIQFGKKFYFCYLCKSFLDHRESSHFIEAEHEERKKEFGPTLEFSNIAHINVIANGIVPGRDMTIECRMCKKTGLKAEDIEEHSKTAEHKENIRKTAIFFTSVLDTSFSEDEDSSSKLVENDSLIEIEQEESIDVAFANVIIDMENRKYRFCCACSERFTNLEKHLGDYKHEIFVKRCKTLFEDQGEKVYCKTCDSEIEWKAIKDHGELHRIPPWSELDKPSFESFYHNHTVCFDKGPCYCFLCQTFLDYWDTAISHFMEDDHQEHKKSFGPIESVHINYRRAVASGIVPGNYMTNECKMCNIILLKGSDIKEHVKTTKHMKNRVKFAADIIRTHEERQNRSDSESNLNFTFNSSEQMTPMTTLEENESLEESANSNKGLHPSSNAAFANAILGSEQTNDLYCCVCCQRLPIREIHLNAYKHKLYIKRFQSVFEDRGRKVFCKTCSSEIEWEATNYHVSLHEIPPWCESRKPDTRKLFRNHTVKFGKWFYYCFLCETFLDYWDTALSHFMETDHQNRKESFGPNELVNTKYRAAVNNGIVPGKDMMNECKMCNITGLKAKDINEHVETEEHKKNKEKFAADKIRKHEGRENCPDSESNALGTEGFSRSELLEADVLAKESKLENMEVSDSPNMIRNFGLQESSKEAMTERRENSREPENVGEGTTEKSEANIAMEGESIEDSDTYSSESEELTSESRKVKGLKIDDNSGNIEEPKSRKIIFNFSSQESSNSIPEGKGNQTESENVIETFHSPAEKHTNLFEAEESTSKLRKTDSLKEQEKPKEIQFRPARNEQEESLDGAFANVFRLQEKSEETIHKDNEISGESGNLCETKTTNSVSNITMEHGKQRNSAESASNTSAFEKSTPELPKGKLLLKDNNSENIEEPVSSNMIFNFRLHESSVSTKENKDRLTESRNVMETFNSPAEQHGEPGDTLFSNKIVPSSTGKNHFCCICGEQKKKLAKHIRNYGHKIHIKRCKSVFEDRGKTVVCKICSSEIEWKEIVFHVKMHEIPPWSKLTEPNSETFYRNRTTHFSQGYCYCYLCETFLDYWDTARSHFMEADHQKRKEKFGPTADLNDSEYSFAVRNGILPGSDMTLECKMCDQTGLKTVDINRHGTSRKHRIRREKISAAMLNEHGKKQEFTDFEPTRNLTFNFSLQKHLNVGSKYADNTCYPLSNFAFANAIISSELNNNLYCCICCIPFTTRDIHLDSYKHKVYLKKCKSFLEDRGKNVFCKKCNLEIEWTAIKDHGRMHRIPPWTEQCPCARAFFKNYTAKFNPGYCYCYLCERFLDYWDDAESHFEDGDHRKRLKELVPVVGFQNVKFAIAKGFAPGKNKVFDCKMCHITCGSKVDMKAHSNTKTHIENYERFTTSIIKEYEESLNFTNSVSDSSNTAPTTSTPMKPDPPTKDDNPKKIQVPYNRNMICNFTLQEIPDKEYEERLNFKYSVSDSSNTAASTSTPMKPDPPTKDDNPKKNIQVPYNRNMICNFTLQEIPDKEIPEAQKSPENYHTTDETEYSKQSINQNIDWPLEYIVSSTSDLYKSTMVSTDMQRKRKIAKQNTEQSDLYCLICYCDMPGYAAVQDHLNGKRHDIARLNYGCDYINLLDGEHYWCSACDVPISGFNNVYRHITSNSHLGASVRKQNINHKSQQNLDQAQNLIEAGESLPYLYIVKQNARKSFCQICDETQSVATKNINDHIASQRHKLALKRYGCDNIVPTGNDDYYCKCCSSNLSNIDRIYLHIKGKKHMSRLIKVCNTESPKGKSIMETQTSPVESNRPSKNLLSEYINEQIQKTLSPEVYKTGQYGMMRNSDVGSNHANCMNISKSFESPGETGFGNLTASEDCKGFGFLPNSNSQVVNRKTENSQGRNKKIPAWEYKVKVEKFPCNICGLKTVDTTRLHVHMAGHFAEEFAKFYSKKGRRTDEMKHRDQPVPQSLLAQPEVVLDEDVSNGVAMNASSIPIVESSNGEIANINSKNDRSELFSESEVTIESNGISLDKKPKRQIVDMRKVAQLLDFDEDYIYDLDDKLKEIELGMMLALVVDSSKMYCLICRDVVEYTLDNYNEHLEDIDHCEYIEEMEADDVAFQDLKDQFSDLALAKEYMEEISDNIVRCVICEEDVEDNGPSLQTHIYHEIHERKCVERRAIARKCFEKIKAKMYCDWYEVQKYWCVVCQSDMNSEVQFVKHLNDIKHEKAVQRRENRNQRLLFDFCASCALLWYGYRSTHYYHNDVNSHKWLQRDGHYVVTKLPEVAKSLLASPEDFVEDKIKFLDDVVESELERVNLFIQDLEKAAKMRFPRSKAYLFGSRISGLGFPDSDIDVFLDCRNLYDGNSSTNDELSLFINGVHQCLCKDPQLWDVHELLVDCRVPIIKATHRVTKLSCDISFENGLSVENSKLIRAFNQIFPPFRKMILFLKQWLLNCGISGSCGITSYALCWFVIFYLQQERILPSVESLIAMRSKSHIIAGWEVGVTHNFTCNDEANTLTIKEMLTRFFSLYANFDFRYHVVSPLLGDVVEKRQFIDPQSLPPGMGRYIEYMRGPGKPEPFRIDSPMCIQDPFDLQHNITKAVKKVYLNRFRKCCAKSLDILWSP